LLNFGVDCNDSKIENNKNRGKREKIFRDDEVQWEVREARIVT
jgi:hypothetical protein